MLQWEDIEVWVVVSVSEVCNERVVQESMPLKASDVFISFDLIGDEKMLNMNIIAHPSFILAFVFCLKYRRKM